MIITDKFVMLNLPKTGSSFARHAIKKLYEKYDAFPYNVLKKIKGIEIPELFELMFPILDTQNNIGFKTQHGTYQQIPHEFRNKKIITITRNPFDRYVSAYLFRWWVDHPYASVARIKDKWPHYPDLSFEEYYQMIHVFGRADRLKQIVPRMDLGISTIQFIQFYFYDPRSVLALMDEEYILKKKYLNDMPEICFLHQENLNAELTNFLLSMGFSNKQVQFIKDEKKINVTSRSQEQKNYSKFYNQNLIKKIQERDKLLFDIFPEYLEVN